jgi:hypothetical protein
LVFHFSLVATPSYSNHFMAEEGTVGLLEGKLLVISGFWLQTNQHLYASKKIHKLAATGLQTILEGLKNTIMIEGSQNCHARKSPRTVIKWVGKHQNPWAT